MGRLGVPPNLMTLSALMEDDAVLVTEVGHTKCGLLNFVETPLEAIFNKWVGTMVWHRCRYWGPVGNPNRR